MYNETALQNKMTYADQNEWLWKGRSYSK